jgi:hypothetical protein
MKLSVSDKARKIVKDRRIRILGIDFLFIKAVVTSDHGTYRVELKRDGRFNCECDNFIYTDSTVECSHVLAIKMHPLYMDWFPNKSVSGEIKELPNIKKLLPIFTLIPRELGKNRPIDERLIRIIEESDKTDLDKFMLKKKWINRLTYQEIVDVVKSELDVDVSKWYVSKTVKVDPREW